jgi:outer membrane protein assembly factor BamB
MKSKGYIIVFAVLALLLTSVISSEISIQNVKGDPQVTASDHLAPGSTVDDWSMYRHDIQRQDSTSPASMVACFGDSTLAIKSVPSAVANGVVYQGANDGYVYAFEFIYRPVIWQHAAASSGVESSAVMRHCLCRLLMGWSQWLRNSLKRNYRHFIWRFATNSGIESSPAIVNGVVYIGSFYGFIYALNATNGALIWSYLTGGSTYSSPAIVDGVLYQGASDGNVYALNADNGALIWAHQTGSQVYASPAVVNNVVYANSDNGSVYALSANDGSEIWHANIGVGDHADASPAVSGGIVYVVARSGLYAFNATSGLEVWSLLLHSHRVNPQDMYIPLPHWRTTLSSGSCDGYIFALNADNASIVWSYRTEFCFCFACNSQRHSLRWIIRLLPIFRRFTFSNGTNANS